MSDWERKARMAVHLAAYDSDPEAVPVYQMPGRRWWFQFWKPKWIEVRGVSRAQLARAHGVRLDP